MGRIYYSMCVVRTFECKIFLEIFESVMQPIFTFQIKYTLLCCVLAYAYMRGLYGNKLCPDEALLEIDCSCWNIYIITFILAIICLWWSPGFTHVLLLLIVPCQLTLQVIINNMLTALQHVNPKPAWRL